MNFTTLSVGHGWVTKQCCTLKTAVPHSWSYLTLTRQPFCTTQCMTASKLHIVSGRFVHSHFLLSDSMLCVFWLIAKLISMEQSTLTAKLHTSLAIGSPQPGKQVSSPEFLAFFWMWKFKFDGLAIQKKTWGIPLRNFYPMKTAKSRATEIPSFESYGWYVLFNSHLDPTN